MPDDCEPLITIPEARELTPKGIGYTTLLQLFRTYGWKLGVKRLYLPRSKFNAWLRGELPLVATTHCTVVERRAAEKAAKAKAAAKSKSA